MFRRWIYFLLSFLFLFPTSCFAKIYINEIFPNPSGDGDEWVELYNNGIEVISFTGWSLKDEKQKEKPLDSLVEINPNGFAVFSCSSGWLNNDKETVFLYDGINPSPIDQYAYTGTTKGLSYARCPDGADNWIVGSPTRESVNPTPTSIPTVTLTPSLSPSPTLTPTNTPTNTPTPTSASTSTPGGESPTNTPTPTPFFSVEIINCSDSVKVGETFEVTIKLENGEANKEFYWKARLREEASSLIKGQTLVGGSQWLVDTSAWDKFPVIKTDGSGFNHGDTAKVWVKPGSETGQYYLQVRLIDKEAYDNENKTEPHINSNEKMITVNPGDPVTTATATSTSKPSGTPTPKPSPSPTPSPTGTVTPTPTPTPKEKLSSGLVGKVLGKKEEGEEKGKEREGNKKSKVLAGGLISLGGGLVIFASLWGKKKTDINFDTMDEDEQEG